MVLTHLSLHNEACLSCLLFGETCLDSQMDYYYYQYYYVVLIALISLQLMTVQFNSKVASLHGYIHDETFAIHAAFNQRIFK